MKIVNEAKCQQLVNANQYQTAAKTVPVVQVAIVVLDKNVVMDVSAVATANVLLATNKLILVVPNVVSNADALHLVAAPQLLKPSVIVVHLARAHPIATVQTNTTFIVSNKNNYFLNNSFINCDYFLDIITIQFN